MAGQAYGAASRRPFFSGNRRVPGLYERTRKPRREGDRPTVAYEAALWLDGRSQRFTLDARTKTDAINELRALRVDAERGELHRSPAAAVTVDELADDWLEHLGSRVGHRDPRRRYSQRTVDLYRQRLQKHISPALGRRPVADVTVADVRRLVDRLGRDGLAPATVTATINILSGLCRFGLKGGHLDHNPVRDLDRDDRPGCARQTEPRYLDPDELARLFAQLSDTFRPVVVTCAYAGLRISETLGLRWRDLDLKAGILTVSGQLGAYGERVPVKTKASAATVPMLPALVRELREHRSRQASRGLRLVHAGELVFVTTRGKPQSRRNALRAIYAAGDAAGLNADGRRPVGLHDMRHSCAGLAYAHGATDVETCELLRHANPRVTSTVYAGLAERDRGGAVRKLRESGFGA